MNISDKKCISVKMYLFEVSNIIAGYFGLEKIEQIESREL